MSKEIFEKHWREIGTSKFILKVIEEGYKLLFKTIPVAAVFKNYNSAKCHQQFVQEAIAELVLTGRVIQSQTTPHVVNPFLFKRMVRRD